MGIVIGQKPIVLNGLTFCVDSLDKDSYSGSGSTWIDLMGNFNLTSISPSYTATPSPSIDFNGSQQIAMAHANLFDFTDCAIEAWLYFDQIGQENGATVWFNTSVGDEFQAAVNTNQIGIAMDGSWPGWTSTSFPSLVGRWSHHCVSRIGSSLQYYVDGTSIVTYSNSTAGNNNSSLIIGQQTGGNHSFDGKMAILRIYSSTGLSSTEVVKNYNAQKDRFGL